jgi:hypothetical protein
MVVSLLYFKKKQNRADCSKFSFEIEACFPDSYEPGSSSPARILIDACFLQIETKKLTGVARALFGNPKTPSEAESGRAANQAAALARIILSLPAD